MFDRVQSQHVMQGSDGDASSDKTCSYDVDTGKLRLNVNKEEQRPCIDSDSQGSEKGLISVPGVGSIDVCVQHEHGSPQGLRAPSAPASLCEVP